MKSSHIPQKAPSPLRTQVLQCSCWRNFISGQWLVGWLLLGGMLPSCTALRRVRKAKKSKGCMQEDGVLRARYSRWSIQCGGSWLSRYAWHGYPVLRTDIASGWSCNIHSPYMFDFCYFWIHELSYLRLYGVNIPLQFFVPFQEEGRKRKITKKKKKSKRKEKKKRKQPRPVPVPSWDPNVPFLA